MSSPEQCWLSPYLTLSCILFENHWPECKKKLGAGLNGVANYSRGLLTGSPWLPCRGTFTGYLSGLGHDSSCMISAKENSILPCEAVKVLWTFGKDLLLVTPSSEAHLEGRPSYTLELPVKVYHVSIGRKRPFHSKRPLTFKMDCTERGVNLFEVVGFF